MRTKYILLTILSSLVFASCNYLDFDETNNLKTKEDMYKYFGTSNQCLPTYTHTCHKATNCLRPPAEFSTEDMETCGMKQ